MGSRELAETYPFGSSSAPVSSGNDREVLATTCVSALPTAVRTPLLRSGAARFEGLLAARRGETKLADERLGTAARELQDIEAPFNLAQIQLEHAEVLGSIGREEEAASLLAQARAVFEQLGARPWLERVDAFEAVVLP